MKKFGFYSFLTAAIIFTGCSQKNVEIDGNTPSDSTQIESSNGTSSSDSKLDRMENGDVVDTNLDTMNSDSQGTSIESEDSKNGTYIIVNGEKRLIENIYFGFDKYNLTSQMRATAKSNSEKLATIDTITKIKVEGNCDEWGSDEYNYALGLKRAKAVKDTLVEDGIPASQVTLISYGESNPACTEHNIDCWKQNRRVEYKLLP